MNLKTNIHFHTQDDPRDRIQHTFYEGIKKAKTLGFEVIALTCHQKFINLPEYRDYASSQNVLLIPGIEKNIEKRHVVILNPDQEVEKVETFNDLEKYKQNHPDIFILAPHPYFYGNFSLKGKLDQYIHLFDAIEHSWFYSHWFNRNKRGGATAKKYHLPFIATSDTHELNLLDISYAVIDTEEKTIKGVFKAIKNNNFTNVTSPRKFWKEMVWDEGQRQIKNLPKKSTN